MAYRYDVDICVVETNGNTSSAILIKGSYKHQAQTRLYRCGFGLDGLQAAVDKTVAYALAACKHYDYIFMNVNKHHSEDNQLITRFYDRFNRCEIQFSENVMFLNDEAHKLSGLEKVEWEDIDSSET